MTAAQWSFAVMCFLLVLAFLIAALWEHEATRLRAALEAEFTEHEWTRLQLHDAAAHIDALERHIIRERRTDTPLAVRAELAQIVRFPGGAS